MRFKIGQRVRVGGPLGPIETITAYDLATDTYTLVSGNSTGYICSGDVVLVPICDYEQLSLF